MIKLAVEELLSQSVCGGANPQNGHLSAHNAVFNASALLLLLLPPPCPGGLSEESCPSVCSLGKAEPVLACPWAAMCSQASEGSWIGEKALMLAGTRLLIN